jgi:hypothetical protein
MLEKKGKIPCKDDLNIEEEEETKKKKNKNNGICLSERRPKYSISQASNQYKSTINDYLQPAPELG